MIRSPTCPVQVLCRLGWELTTADYSNDPRCRQQANMSSLESPWRLWHNTLKTFYHRRKGGHRQMVFVPETNDSELHNENPIRLSRSWLEISWDRQSIHLNLCAGITSSGVREIDWIGITWLQARVISVIQNTRQCDKRGESNLYQVQAVNTNVHIIIVQ